MGRIVGKNIATAGIALVSVGAIAGASAVQPPPGRASQPISVVQLAAASATVVPRPPTPFAQRAAASPAVVQSPAPVQRAGVLQSLVELDLGRFVIPPSVTQAAPTAPPIPEPSPTAVEFEDLIIDTYHAIEPWVRYGFELVTWGVGWVPWVGWLAPQIMIFYDFGESIVESLVVNSANWLWGPLPFGEGLVNVGQDSWDALVQLGIDQWNFWLWPLPPLPLQAEQSLANEETTEFGVTTGAVASVDEQAAPVSGSDPRRDDTVRPHRKDEGTGWQRVARQDVPDVEDVPDGEEVADVQDVPDAEDVPSVEDVPGEETAVPAEGTVTAAKEEGAATAAEESATSDDEKQPASRKSFDTKPKKESAETSSSRTESHNDNDGRSAKRDYTSSSRHSSSAAE